MASAFTRVFTGVKTIIRNGAIKTFKIIPKKKLVANIPENIGKNVDNLVKFGVHGSDNVSLIMKNGLDDFVKNGIKGVKNFKKLGIKTKDDFEKIGIKSADDFAKVGITSADDFAKLGFKFDEIPPGVIFNKNMYNTALKKALRNSLAKRFAKAGVATGAVYLGLASSNYFKNNLASFIIEDIKSETYFGKNIEYTGQTVYKLIYSINSTNSYDTNPILETDAVDIFISTIKDNQERVYNLFEITDLIESGTIEDTKKGYIIINIPFGFEINLPYNNYYTTNPSTSTCNIENADVFYGAYDKKIPIDNITCEYLNIVAFKDKEKIIDDVDQFNDLEIGNYENPSDESLNKYVELLCFMDKSTSTTCDSGFYKTIKDNAGNFDVGFITLHTTFENQLEKINKDILSGDILTNTFGSFTKYIYIIFTIISSIIAIIILSSISTFITLLMPRSIYLIYLIYFIIILSCITLCVLFNQEIIP